MKKQSQSWTTPKRKLWRSSRLTLLVCLLFWSRPASANKPVDRIVCDTDDPASCAAEIYTGEPAPFDGQILTATLAASLGVKAAACEVRIASERTFARKRAEMDAVYARRLIELERDTARKERNAALRASKRGILESPWLWLIIGAAAMTGAFSVAKGIDRATD